MGRLFDEGGIQRYGPTFTEVRRDARRKRTLVAIRISGVIKCRNGITIQVDKALEARDAPRGYEVKGCDYNYHTWIEGTEREVLRYDTGHYWKGLHCPVFDIETGDERMFLVETEQLPTLDAFIRIVIKRVGAAITPK